MKKRIIAIIVLTMSLLLVVNTALAYGLPTPVSLAFREKLYASGFYPDTNGRIKVSVNAKIYRQLTGGYPVTDLPQTFKVASMDGSTVVSRMSFGADTSWNTSVTFQNLNPSTSYKIEFRNYTRTRYIRGDGSIYWGV